LCAHLPNVELFGRLRGLFGKLPRVDTINPLALRDLARRDEVRSHADGRVQFEPRHFLARTSVLLVKPLYASRAAEPGRVGRECGYNASQRGRVQRHEVVQDWRGFFQLKELQHAVVVRDADEEAAFASRFKVVDEAASRHGRVDLVDGNERGVGRTNLLRAALRDWLRETTAHLGKECLNVPILVFLRGVVGGPVLAVRLPDRFDGHRRDGFRPVGVALGLRDRETHGVNVLARLAPYREIGARAIHPFEIDRVSSPARLRGNVPKFADLCDRAGFRDDKAPLFSRRHGVPPCDVIMVIKIP
jgi:hypothetical protein